MRRRGFTLLEVTISIGILMTILAIVINSFVGTRKAQGSTVTASLLKVGGQRAAKNLYMELTQSRKLIASLNTDPSPDLSTQYYGIMDIPTQPAPVPAAERIFPRITPKGGFGVPGTSPGTLDPATVGNALMFAVPGDPVVLSDTNVFVREGSGGSNHEMRVIPYKMPTYKFLLYHLVRVPLPAGARPLDGGKTYTTQLMRWESKPFYEKGDLNMLITRYAFPNMASLGATGAQWNDLPNRLPNCGGYWDSSATSAANALVLYPTVTLQFTPSLAVVPGPWGVDPSPQIPMSRQSWPVSTNLSGYALPMMSFNTKGNPNFTVPGLDVPAYASAPSTVPYGFETAICGPIGARQVLIRLALAARLTAGNTTYGLAHQEIVKAFDM